MLTKWGERTPVQVTGSRKSGRGPGARLCCICFCVSSCWWHLRPAAMLLTTISGVFTYSSPTPTGSSR